tara:strand:+ start:103 stop:429 length:327 start_codon:yes stop_codon:yes gene_type:complete
MPCKIVVRRFTEGLDFAGDCVNAYPFDEYLGPLVEQHGGAFVIVEVSDATFDNEDVQSLLEPNLNPKSHNMIYGLKPVEQGDEFFNELLVFGRINITIEKLLEYKVTH